MGKKRKRPTTLGDYFGEAIGKVTHPVGGAIGDAADHVGGAISGIGSAITGAVPRPAGHYPSRTPARPIQGPKMPVPKLPKPVATKPVSKPVSRPKAPVRTVVRPAAGSGSKGVSGPPPSKSRPKTFTDGHGVVRNLAPVGSKTRKVTRKGVKPKPSTAAAEVDPITKMVDDIIAGMNKPIEAQKAAVDAQARGNQDVNHRLANTYDERLGQLRSTGNLDMGAALNRAAELKGLSADTIAKNQQWLMSLMGPDLGGGGAQAAQADAAESQTLAAGENDRIAQQMAGGGQRLNDFLVAAQAGGRGMEREFAYQDQLRARAQQKELDAQMAANTGQKAKLTYDMQTAAADQELKQAVAQQEFGLDLAKIKSQNTRAALDRESRENIAKGQAATTLTAAQIRAGASAKSKAPKPGRYYGLPKNFDAVIDGVYSGLGRDARNEKVGLSTPWRSAFERLTDHKVPPNKAAAIATDWFADSVSSKKSTPKNVYTMLKNRGVSDFTARNIITKGFGPKGWEAALARGPISGAAGNAGVDFVNRVLGS